MLSPWDKCVISRAARSGRDRRWLVRAARLARRDSERGLTPSYRRIRGFRLNAAQVAIVGVRRNPRALMQAIGAVLIYLAVIVYFAIEHLR